METRCKICQKPGHKTGECNYPKEAKKQNPESEKGSWEAYVGDKEIGELVSADRTYLGHSTGRIDWLLEGNDMRVGRGGAGSLEITSIVMPNTPAEFVAHLKMRVDPEIDHYHKGQYVVVLSVPPDFYQSRGFHPANREAISAIAPQAMKNVKLITEEESHFSSPTRFILGYYDGGSNTFYRNPEWEEDPAPTAFGLAAEEVMQDYLESPKQVAASSDVELHNRVTLSDDDEIDIW